MVFIADLYFSRNYLEIHRTTECGSCVKSSGLAEQRPLALQMKQDKSLARSSFIFSKDLFGNCVPGFVVDPGLHKLAWKISSSSLPGFSQARL